MIEMIHVKLLLPTVPYWDCQVFSFVGYLEAASQHLREGLRILTDCCPWPLRFPGCPRQGSWVTRLAAGQACLIQLAFFFFKCLPEDILSLLLKREEGREEERERKSERQRNIHQLSPGWGSNPCVCPAHKLNLWPCGLEDDAPTNRAIPARTQLAFKDIGGKE